MENLLNIADRIVVIAVIAIGMTMVIITAGIDLSVGSLVALSAVTGTWFITRVGGAEQASVMAMALGGLLAILLCAGVGFFSGTDRCLARHSALHRHLGHDAGR